jgi:hypothetical protein
VEPEKSLFFLSSWWWFAAIWLARFCKICCLVVVSVLLGAISLSLEESERYSGFELFSILHWSWRTTRSVLLKGDLHILDISPLSPHDSKSSSMLFWNNLVQVSGFCNWKNEYLNIQNVTFILVKWQQENEINLVLTFSISWLRECDPLNWLRALSLFCFVPLWNMCFCNKM